MEEMEKISKFIGKNWVDGVVAILLTLVVIRPVLDPDLGWHLRLGEEIVKTGKIVSGDSLSFSLPGYEFVNHAWLQDIVLFKLYEWFGLWGVSLVYGGLTAAGLWLIYKTTEKLLSKKGLAVLVGVAAIYMVEFVGLRAHAVTIVGLGVLWYLLNGFNTSKVRPLTWGLSWVLLLLFGVWANLHAGFVLGFLVWGLWWGAGVMLRVVDDKKLTIRNDETFHLMLMVAAAAATLVNPYGIGVWQFALKLAENSAAGVFNSDWVPLLSSRLPSASLLMRIGLVLMYAVAMIGRKNVRQKLVASVLMVMTIVSIRYSLVLLILIIPLLLVSVEKMLDDWAEKIDRRACLMGCGVVVGLVVAKNWPQMACAYESSECFGRLGNYPYKAVEYMKENNLSGNVFNYYTWGGYLEWQLPENKYFIDGRMDSFYVDGGSFLAEFARIVEMAEPDSVRDEWKETFEKYEVDYVVMPKEMKLVDGLEKNGWKRVVEGEVEVVMEKN